MRRIVGFASFVLATALTVFAAGCTDCQAGYQQGQDEARKLRKDLGPIVKPLHGLAEEMGRDMSVDGKSESWNDGYRQGVRDEFKK